MGQTKDGALKIAASKIGVTLEDYRAKFAAGLKWCTGCKTWHMGILSRPEFQWPLPNVWLGVSVEDQATADERIPLLLRTPAAVRFVSYEPALGPVNLLRYMSVPLAEIDNPGAMLDWVIVGGESGPGARPFDIQWARNTVAQCKAAGVACFVKQVGSVPMERGERWRYEPKLKDRKGGDWEEWPEDLRVREFPEVRV